MNNHCIAIYVRVSTLEQAENNWSIEGQMNEIRKYCDGKGYRVVRIYKDLGYSAKSIERPGLQKLLDHAIQRKFQGVIVWRYDRLSRDKVDFPALFHFFQKLNIQVESVNEPMNDGSPMSEFIVMILGLISDLERKTFRMRSDMGKKTRAENGFYMASMPPLGFSFDRNTGHLEINEEEASIVKTIFEKYLEHESLFYVKNYLHDNDIATKRGGKWHQNTVKCILKNRVYLGEYKYKNIITHHEGLRIVSEELFENTQAKLEERKNLGPNRYYNKEIEKYLGELNWTNDTENEVIQEYLQKKANMPLCPKCNDSFNVRLEGYDYQKEKRQEYYCKKCHYTFLQDSDLKGYRRNAKKRKPCPKCKSADDVRLYGLYNSPIHGKIQRYYCNECKKVFKDELSQY